MAGNPTTHTSSSRVRGRSQFLSGGCNTHGHCMSWARAQPHVVSGSVDHRGVVAYACHNWIALATSEGRVTRSLTGHTGPVHSLAWLEPATVLVSGSVDGTVRLWLRGQEGEEQHYPWQAGEVLIPSSSGQAGGGALLGVTSVATVVKGSVRLIVATTARGVTVWSQQGSASWGEVMSSILPPTQILLCLAVVALSGGHFAVFAGGVDSKVHVWSGSLAEGGGGGGSWGWVKAGALSGHQDWIRTLDFYYCSPGEEKEKEEAAGGGVIGYLASGAQDCKIRIWQIRSLTQQPVPGAVNGEDRGDADGDNDDEEEEAAERPEDEDHELRLILEEVKADGVGGTGSRFGVSLDALLVGHEDWVTGVRWQPPPPKQAEGGEEDLHLSLLSSSMDRSLIIWRPEGASADKGVWVPHVRLGDVGSDIGGPIGGNLLGFMGCDFAEEGATVLAYGFGGSFHAYKRPPTPSLANGTSSRSTPPPMSLFRPVSFCSGHFAEVTDLQWDPLGRYLISVSKDQTCRLFCPVLSEAGSSSSSSSKEFSSYYHEMSRVQVHGYDLTCVDMVAGIEHRVVSGADEKTIRVFDATNKVLSLLHELCGVESSSPARVETAYVPALGLSNKAVALRREGEEEDEAQEKGNKKGGDGDDGEAISKARTRVVWRDRGPPLEQELVDHTLWPEVQKLFCHGHGITCLAISHRGTLMASASKAREAGSAAIRLWDPSTWRSAGLLPGHQSTVVQLAFSHDDTLLVSVSRDRQICLFAASGDGGSSDVFRLVHACGRAHKRIIWSCSWSHDDALLATGSRDGTVKLWTRTVGEGGLAKLQEAASFEPTSKAGDGSVSVTAVAFLPRPPSFSGRTGTTYVLAVGLERGDIEIWAGGSSSASWSQLCRLFEDEGGRAHAATVRRLRWRPPSRQQRQHGAPSPAELASCGADHAIRVTVIEGV